MQTLNKERVNQKLVMTLILMQGTHKDNSSNGDREEGHREPGGGTCQNLGQHVPLISEV